MCHDAADEDPVQEVWSSSEGEIERTPEVMARERFACGATEDAIELLPVLADRPVVSRPDVPLHLLGGAAIGLYVSTPIWVRLKTGTRVLLEVPSRAMKNTWFGDHGSGELCYGSRTRARMRLGELPIRSHRAVTRVELRNRSSRTLDLERLNLPVPQLRLFASAEGDSGPRWSRSSPRRVGSRRSSTSATRRRRKPAEPP